MELTQLRTMSLGLKILTDQHSEFQTCLVQEILVFFALSKLDFLLLYN